MYSLQQACRAVNACHFSAVNMSIDGVVVVVVVEECWAQVG